MYLLRHSRGTQTDIQVDQHGHLYYSASSSGEPPNYNHASSVASNITFADTNKDVPVNHPNTLIAASSDQMLEESAFLPIHQEQPQMQWDASPPYNRIPGGWSDGDIDVDDRATNTNHGFKEPQGHEHGSWNVEEVKETIHYAFDYLGKLFRQYPWLFERVSLDNWQGDEAQASQATEGRRSTGDADSGYCGTP